MDGIPPVLSKQQIQNLWSYAGGSPAYSDIASAVALATSGGRPDYVAQQSDGTVNRGLWGINSSKGQLSSNDPVANARGAIELSNGGRDWRDWPAAYDSSGYLGPTSVVRSLTGSGSSMGQYPSAGNRPATTVGVANDDDILSRVLDFLGLPDLRDLAGVWLRATFFILGGASMMIVGLVIMFFSLRQVKNVGTFVLETGASGLGFGAGAALVSRGEKATAATAAQASAVPASATPTTAVAPRNPPKPPPPASQPVTAPIGGFRAIGSAPAQNVGRAAVSPPPPKPGRMPKTSVGKFPKRPPSTKRSYRVLLSPVSGGGSNPQPRRPYSSPLNRPPNPARKWESSIFSPPGYQGRHRAED